MDCDFLSHPSLSVFLGKYFQSTIQVSGLAGLDESCNCRESCPDTVQAPRGSCCYMERILRQNAEGEGKGRTSLLKMALKYLDVKIPTVSDVKNKKALVESLSRKYYWLWYEMIFDVFFLWTSAIFYSN
jgi:hypothetical protein